MQFYGKAEQSAKRILSLFESGDVPAALAPIFIRRKDAVPCRAWSWSNQLLTALAGHDDARGFRQWQGVDRHVCKGEHGLPHRRPRAEQACGMNGAAIRPLDGPVVASVRLR